MENTIFGFLVLIAFAFFIGHLFRLGTPYIKMEYLAGSPMYYVYIRRFMGYNDLAGMCGTEELARELLEHIKRNPGRTLT